MLRDEALNLGELEPAFRQLEAACEQSWHRSVRNMGEAYEQLAIAMSEDATPFSTMATVARQILVVNLRTSVDDGAGGFVSATTVLCRRSCHTMPVQGNLRRQAQIAPWMASLQPNGVDHMAISYTLSDDRVLTKIYNHLRQTPASFRLGIKHLQTKYSSRQCLKEALAAWAVTPKNAKSKTARRGGRRSIQLANGSWCHKKPTLSMMSPGYRATAALLSLRAADPAGSPEIQQAIVLLGLLLRGTLDGSDIPGGDLFGSRYGDVSKLDVGARWTAEAVLDDPAALRDWMNCVKRAWRFLRVQLKTNERTDGLIVNQPAPSSCGLQNSRVADWASTEQLHTLTPVSTSSDQAPASQNQTPDPGIHITDMDSVIACPDASLQVGQTSSRRGKRRPYRRGRPTDTDKAADAELAARWKAAYQSHHLTIVEFAREIGMDEKEVRRTLNRVSKRRKKS